MTTALLQPPPASAAALPPQNPVEIYRLTVEQYHQMGAAGVIPDGDPVELLEGWLVRKPMKNPPHAVSADLTRDALIRLLPQGWFVKTQDPITLDDSEPEPDIMVVRGSTRDYTTRHPVPSEAPLVVEVAESTLASDRNWKKRIYARNGLPVYWIVNLIDRVLEVYTAPAGQDYANAVRLTEADTVTLELDGRTVGTIPVASLLP